VALTFDGDGNLAWSRVRDKEFSTWQVQPVQQIANAVRLQETDLVDAISQDRQRIAYVTGENEIVVWDLVAGRQLHTFRDIWVDRLAFSPDGDILAGGGPATIVLWDLRTGKELDRLTAHEFEEQVAGLAFSRDGGRLAAHSGHMTFIWHVPTSAEDQGHPKARPAVC
jgi:WD40 repeat protein